MEKLKDIEQFAEANKIPILRLEARKILEKLILKNKPRNILEIGTAIGFSGSFMLLLSPESKLTTIEKSKEMIEIASQNFIKQNLIERVEILEGDATEIVKNLNSQYDFIFLDGPKAQYVYQLPYLLKLLSSNGVILADNVLFRGLTRSEMPVPKKYKTIVMNLRKFIQQVQYNPQLKSEILPVGDGLMIITKNNNQLTV